MTMTEVLAEIRNRQGEAVLPDGKRLLGFFEDYSRGKLKPEFNALRLLVECGGNRRIAQLQKAPALQQQTELHRLVQEMVTEHSMQESIALTVCSAVWEAFCGSAFPLTPDRTAQQPPHREAPPREPQPEPQAQPQPQPEPRPKPQLQPQPQLKFQPKPQPQKNPQPNDVASDQKPTPSSPRISKWERRRRLVRRCMLAVGAAGAIGEAVTAVVILTTWRAESLSIGAICCALLAVMTVWRLIRTWQGKIDQIIPSDAYRTYSQVAIFLFHGLGILAFPFALAGAITESSWPGIFLSISWVGNAVFNIYWHYTISF